MEGKWSRQSPPPSCMPWSVSESRDLHFLASLVAWMVKNLPAMQETWIPSLGWEDPLGKEMVTLKHSSSVGQQHHPRLGSGMGLE